MENENYDNNENLSLISKFSTSDASIKSFNNIKNPCYNNSVDDNISILTPSEASNEISEGDYEENDVLTEDNKEIYFDNFFEINYHQINATDKERKVEAYKEYVRMCLESDYPPVKGLEDVLSGKGDELDLQSYKLHNGNLYLICQTLIGPPAYTIRHLNLRNVSLNEDACATLSELLEMNPHLQILNLENCRIGLKGINNLSDGIHLSNGILHLNLSKCDLKDRGGVIIAKSLLKNDVCKSIDLSHNELHVLTATELNNTFKENTILEAINLSWNEFHPENDTSIKLLNGLQKNESIKELDLSWNGISGNGFARTLVKLFRNNKSLKKVNIENNYLQPENIKIIAQGLKNATTLEEFYIGNNFATSEENLLLIKSLENNKNLELLSLGEHTWLEKNTYKLAKDMMKKRPELQIIFKEKLYPNPPEPVDFKSLIIDRAKYFAMNPKKKKLKKDLGHFMLNLIQHDQDIVTENEFIELVKNFKLILDDDLIKHLTDEFSQTPQSKKKAVKKIQIKQMAEYYLNKYPTEPPPPKTQKKKKKKQKKLK